MSSKKPKIYVYVDETGQDTQGQIFIVICIIIIGVDHKIKTAQLLEKIEKQTNKKAKWHKSSKKAKLNYLSKLNQLPDFKIYVKIFKKEQDYFLNTIKSIIQSIKSVKYYRKSKFVIIIDGLPKANINSAKKLIRQEKITVDKLKGLKDEQDSFLRLADNMAGLIREIQESHHYLFSSFEKLSSRIQFLDKNKTPKIREFYN